MNKRSLKCKYDIEEGVPILLINKCGYVYGIFEGEEFLNKHLHTVNIRVKHAYNINDFKAKCGLITLNHVTNIAFRAEAFNKGRKLKAMYKRLRILINSIQIN